MSPVIAFPVEVLSFLLCGWQDLERAEIITACAGTIMPQNLIYDTCWFSFLLFDCSSNFGSFSILRLPSEKGRMSSKMLSTQWSL